MPENLRSDSSSSTASLVGEIIADAQKLIRQEMELAKAELRADWKRAKTSGIEMGVALFVGFLGAFFVSGAVVFLLNAITELPLWACFAIVSAIMIGGAALLYARARRHIKELEVVPRQTVDSIKESVQWIKNRT